MSKKDKIDLDNMTYDKMGKSQYIKKLKRREQSRKHKKTLK